MGNFFKNSWRELRQGLAEGIEDTGIAPWQRELNNLYTDVADKSISDEELVDKYLTFRPKYPEKIIIEKVSSLLDTIIEKRPTTVQIIDSRFNQLKSQQE